MKNYVFQEYIYICYWYYISTQFSFCYLIILYCLIEFYLETEIIIKFNLSTCELKYNNECNIWKE